MGFLKNLLKVNKLSRENEKLKNQFQELSKEYAEFKKNYYLLEKRVTELDKSFNDTNASQKTIPASAEAVNPDKIKSSNSQENQSEISASICQQPYKEEEKHFDKEVQPPTYNDQELEDNLVVEEPKSIIPKKLNISGYDSISNLIYLNLSERVNSSNVIEFSFICGSLPIIGKELIFKRITNRNKKNEDVYNSKIIKLAKTVIETKENGDIDGHKRALAAFNEKYKIESDFFDKEYPVDFFQSEEMTSFECCSYLYEFLLKWKNVVFHKMENSDLIDGDIEKTEIEIVYDDYFTFIVKFLNSLAYIRSRGYLICIVPIFDENILYRPKRAAQDKKYLSFLYYDKYVEIDDKELDNTTTSVVEGGTISYYGSEYVSGHYRQGHYRNGRWVSGGYVKGHYRSR